MDGKADGANTDRSLKLPIPLIPRFELGRLWWRSTARRPPEQTPGAVEALRDALAREETLIGHMKSVIDDHEMLRDESDHRLLNGLQMVISLLMMQARA